MPEPTTLPHAERGELEVATCPICSHEIPEGSPHFTSLSSELQEIIAANAPSDILLEQICPRCIRLFERAALQIRTHSNVFEQSGHILPTPLRLDADERFLGRGVTVAFLDSGFYAHPDLTTPQNRILKYHSVFEREDDQSSLETIDVSSWHGMMTSVVAAGNGALSDGIYRGIAPKSNLVLVKILKAGAGIREEFIRRGLQWVLENRQRYNIRVVNISAGGDFERSYLHNTLSQLVETAVSQGVVVVCAVGNAGLAPGHPVLPPASSPSAISVGGLDDQNSLDRARRGMYRSSYGPTIDGLQKPEVIAPGIWVPAPILPHTPTAKAAELYSNLYSASDGELHEIIDGNSGVDSELDEARSLPAYLVRQLITIKLREGNVISKYYKHVDGTSFAAPIVSSIVACMLEANPSLTPQQVKRILMDSAERLPMIEVERQGWGVVSARKAVEMAISYRGRSS